MLDMISYWLKLKISCLSEKTGDEFLKFKHKIKKGEYWQRGGMVHHGLNTYISWLVTSLRSIATHNGRPSDRKGLKLIFVFNNNIITNFKEKKIIITINLTSVQKVKPILCSTYTVHT